MAQSITDYLRLRTYRVNHLLKRRSPNQWSGLCRVKSWLTGRRLVSLPFADHCDPLASNPEELNDLLVRVKQCDVGKSEYIEIRPTLHQPEHTGFEKSATYWIHNMDLSKSKHELFCNFHKTSIQAKIRKAEREGLRYEEGNSKNIQADFYVCWLRPVGGTVYRPSPGPGFARLAALSATI